MKCFPIFLVLLRHKHLLSKPIFISQKSYIKLSYKELCNFQKYIHITRLILDHLT